MLNRDNTRELHQPSGALRGFIVFIVFTIR